MDKKKCLIYDKRPDLCRDFPVKASNIKYFDKCTYKFDEKGVRSGECCRCDQCCKESHMRWPKDLLPGDVPDKETADSLLAVRIDDNGKTIKDIICRHYNG